MYLTSVYLVTVFFPNLTKNDHKEIFFLIEVQLIYNVVLVSHVQQSDSVISKHSF